VRTLSNIEIEDAPNGVNSSGEVEDQTGVRLLKIGDDYHSAVRLINGVPDPLQPPVFRYIRCLDLMSVYRPDAESFLFLGLGGGINASRIAHAHPDAYLKAVEQNIYVVKYASTYFGLEPNRVSIVPMDAFEWIDEAGDLTFDVICVDMLRDIRDYPKDFLSRVKAHLNPNGLLAMNTVGPISRFTVEYADLFENVHLYPVNNGIGETDLNHDLLNVEMFASDGALEIDEDTYLGLAEDSVMRRLFRDMRAL
jgi:SAM-dependent methyltransferase